MIMNPADLPNCVFHKGYVGWLMII
jgi:hypothetical protein